MRALSSGCVFWLFMGPSNFFLAARPNGLDKRDPAGRPGSRCGEEGDLQLCDQVSGFREPRAPDCGLCKCLSGSSPRRGTGARAGCGWVLPCLHVGQAPVIRLKLRLCLNTFPAAAPLRSPEARAHHRVAPQCPPCPPHQQHEGFFSHLHRENLVGSRR